MDFNGTLKRTACLLLSSSNGLRAVVQRLHVIGKSSTVLYSTANVQFIWRRLWSPCVGTFRRRVYKTCTFHWVNTTNQIPITIVIKKNEEFQTTFVKFNHTLVEFISAGCKCLLTPRLHYSLGNYIMGKSCLTQL